MTAQIPADFAPFVERMVAARRFLTAEDVLAEALRLLQARESLRQEVRSGFEQLDAGLGIDSATVYQHAEEHIREVAVRKPGTS